MFGWNHQPIIIVTINSKWKCTQCIFGHSTGSDREVSSCLFAYGHGGLEFGGKKSWGEFCKVYLSMIDMINKNMIRDISIIYGGSIPLHNSGHVHTRSDDNDHDGGGHDRDDDHIQNVLLQILRIPRNLALLLSCDDDDGGGGVVEERGGVEEADGEDHSDHNDDDGRCILQDPEPVRESQESSGLWLQQAEPLPSWL